MFQRPKYKQIRKYLNENFEAITILQIQIGQPPEIE